MARLLAQAVIATGIGNRRRGNLHAGLHTIRRRCRLEPVEHILDMFGTGIARLQHQFHGNQHCLQSGLGYGGEHLGHDAITPLRA